MRKLEVTTTPGWPVGVHFLGGGLYRVGIVVADQLPRDRSTLLVRLMAAGTALPGAITDLATLPEDAYERAVVEQILIRLRHVIGKKTDRTPEEEEFIVRIHGTWKDARIEGEAIARASSVLTVLRTRGITVPDAARERILAEKNAKRLERWLEKAVVAASVVEVIGKPS